MANMLGMMKKAATMQKQMKRLQKDLARRTATGASGGVEVVVRGDMTLQKIALPEDVVPEAKRAGLEKAIVAAANAALKTAKDEAGAEMSKMSGGLGGLLDQLQ